MSHRLSKRGDVELTRQLLMAGRDVGPPPPDALQRTLERVELAAAAGLLATSAVVPHAAAATANVKAASLVSAALAAPAKGIAGFGGSGVIAKWFISGLCVGMTSGGAMTVAAYHFTNNDEPAPIVTPSSAPAARPASHAAKPFGSVQSDAPTVGPVPTTSESSAENLRQPRPPSAPPDVVGAARAQSQPASDQPLDPSLISPALARELAMLDAARTALESGNPRESLRALERHRRQFPNGQLLPEAELLRVRADAQIATESNRSVPTQDVSQQ